MPLPPRTMLIKTDDAHKMRQGLFFASKDDIDYFNRKNTIRGVQIFVGSIAGTLTLMALLRQIRATKK